MYYISFVSTRIFRLERSSPGGAGHPGNPQLFGNLALVNRNSAKLTGSLVPFDRVSLNRGDVDISTEVSGEIWMTVCVKSAKAQAHSEDRDVLTTEVST